MEQINLSIDCLVLGYSDDQKLKALLIKKIINKDNDLQYALPGDLVGYDEDLNTASKRILKWFKPPAFKLMLEKSVSIK